MVDWGDRFNPDTNVVTTTSQGGPWPDGDLTHTYTHVDSGVTIRVTQRWRVAWAQGDDRGVLEGLTTTAVVEGYRVTEIQAVRIRRHLAAGTGAVLPPNSPASTHQAPGSAGSGSSSTVAAEAALEAKLDPPVLPGARHTLYP